MTTPKKGDLVIVRENHGFFRGYDLYLAECVIGHGYHIVGLERLSDRYPIVVDLDARSDSKFTIEEVIPKEKLPKQTQIDKYIPWSIMNCAREVQSPQPGHFVPANEWSRYEEFCKHHPNTPEDTFSSLYPLEVGDEVDVIKHDRATGLYSCEPGEVILRGESSAKVKGRLSRKLYSVDAKTGMESGHPDYPAYAHITRKRKPKQNMCNKKFEYKPGQKFYSTSGIKFEVMIVNANGTIAYARRISEPMWFTRIEYSDGKHVCVDDPCVTFKTIDPPLVAEVKELVKLLHEYPEKFDKIGEHTLRSLHHWLFVAQ